ncbi:SDR family oxidoreductase [Rhodococcus wratislaviensis]|uniref:Putative oxidoreductase n=1 Tax=Rhodococcus wratislaviensis NBRC 100605 TaxID=1219028 RepID=X0PWB5_RHOWR|nr:SDR family oxidoreductase [Rhodococcus wratislaviensis]GAF47644.1 putative oxidoreductase [Rhodococcus wratislaviensis NBRC 100605]
MVRNVSVVVGNGGMGRAISRRIGSGRTLLIADRDPDSLEPVAERMREDGFDVTSTGVDVTSPESIAALAETARGLGQVTQLVHTAGVSPAQGGIEQILAVDILGPALVLDEFVEVVAPGAAAVVISSNAGHMVSEPLTPEDQLLLRTTPAQDLLGMSLISPDRFTDRAVAYMFAKRVARLRVQGAAKAWARRGSRVNSISPGVVATPMGRAERSSGNTFVERLIALSPAGRAATAEEIADAVVFLLGPAAAFITGADLLVDGGAIAAIDSGQLPTHS